MMDDELLERVRDNFTDRGVAQFCNAWTSGDDVQRERLMKQLEWLESRDSETYH